MTEEEFIALIHEQYGSYYKIIAVNAERQIALAEQIIQDRRIGWALFELRKGALHVTSISMPLEDTNL